MKEKKTWYKGMGKALLLLSLITVLGMPSSVLAGGSTTLSVRSGQNITAQLKKAVKKYNTIRIPGGTYQISGNIALDNKTVIQPKSGKVVLQQTRSGKSIFTANGAKRLTIKGITLDGQGRSGALLSIKRASSVSVSNVCFVNSRRQGFYLDRGAATISNCSFVNNASTALYAAGSGKLVLRNSEISGGTEGIQLNSKRQAQLSGVQVADVSRTGILVRGRARVLKATNCSILRSGVRGVYIQSKSSASLQNCTVSGCGTEGVNVNKGTATLTNCLITGNGRQQQTALYNSIGYGVHILNGAKVTMRGGKVNSNLGYGVLCGNGTLDVQGSAQSYAEFMYNAWSGLSFSGRKTAITMNYARCSENGHDPKGNSEGQNGHGLGVTDGAKGTVRNSIFDNNGVCGVSLFGTGAVLDISGCTANNNGRHGIGGRRGVTLTASQMTLNGNAWHGIMLLDNSTGQMNNITASNNTKFGLDIGQTTKPVAVNGCRTDGNNDGVYIYSARNVQVRNTTARGNVRYGLYVAKDASAALSGNNFTGNYRKDTNLN